MTEADFVHLHVHSNFSFKDATAHPHELIKAAAFYEMPAVALTDHSTLAGAIRFYRAAQGSGVRPIIGTELELASGHHLTLLAENFSGYSNLCRLLSELHLTQPRQTPLAALDVIERYREGIICLTGCAHSRLSQDILADKHQDSLVFLRAVQAIFPDSCYLELENPLLPESPKLLFQLARLGRELELPLVATNNVHFLRKADHPVRDLLTCMGENITIYQPHERRHSNDQRYFKGPKNMAKLFSDYPEAIRNTRSIAERCDLKLPLGEYRFPYFHLPAGETAASYLRKLCEQGAAERYGRIPEPVQTRMEHELGIIAQLGFCEYFLAIWDIVNFARREHIRCAGRGSAADSLVAYLLGLYPPRVLLHDARLLGIPIHPIDVNASAANFTVEKGGIRVGLRTLQGLNDQQIADICQARAESPFLSFHDFMWRVSLPEKTAHNLIRIGAFEQIAPGADLLAELPGYYDQSKQHPQGQFTLSLPTEQVQMAQPRIDYSERIFTELELTGLYITAHPLSLYRPLLQRYGAIDSRLLRTYQDGEKVRVAGIIVSRQTPPTKSKQRVIFLTIEDELGLIDAAVFSHAQQKYAQIAFGCTLLLIEGTVRKTGPESISITAEHLYDLRRLAKK